jgi:molecular chaperone DnaK (HSP70)
MAEARYLVGIDLGTVNSALAAVDLAASGAGEGAASPFARREETTGCEGRGQAGSGPVELCSAGRGRPSPLGTRAAEPPRKIDLSQAVAPLPIPQRVTRDAVAARRLLPSAAYLPGPELPPGALALPWGTQHVLVGQLAREEGARVPGRLVTSAKSWLATDRVDRTAAILPWGAPEGVPRLSPVRASALYLAHLRGAWDDAHPDAPLAEQEVTLAVPASFDAAARELTLAAAREAGLGRVTLVEEPAAAFHEWAARHRADLEAALGGARLVLVVDVGGGTTDLTLVAARVEDGRPTFTRLAVGDHLLLGGDNVDLALARAVEGRLGERLDPVRFASLVLACRDVKERLLVDGGPDRLPVAVVGRGSRLVASAVSAEVTAAEVRAVLLEGFFPLVAPDARPRRAPRTAALAELGLAYEQDPAVTRHVAAFLAAHAEEAGAARGGLARPEAILVNGGVFTPPAVRERLREAVAGLFPGAPAPRLLANPALDLAVARGAVHAALVRRGIGLKVGGGTPRAFYVGIATPEGERALCVVPRHQEEGTRVEVPRTFALALGRPVRFALWASAGARLERAGDVVPLGEDLVELPPVEAVLRGDPGSSSVGGAGRGGTATAEVAVRLEAALTEIGTLELWCVAADRDARWKLEFSLRSGAPAEPRGEVGATPRRLVEARALVETFYGKKAPVEKKEVKGLFRALEKTLGPREQWSTPVVRDLWAALHAGRPRRRRSADHERVWLQLTGWALRPGFGAPLDAWRASETWAVFGEGLQYQADPRAWAAWWVLWRRISGGLEAGWQERLFETVAPFVRSRDPRKPSPRVPGARAEAVDEMIRLAGSLERIDPSEKVEAGEWILERLGSEGAQPHLTWALGRLGARVPFHGSAHQVIPARTAEEWVERLLDLGLPYRELVFPLVQLARRSGDRARDVDDDLRHRAAAAVESAGALAATVRMLTDVTEVTADEEQRIFGDSLPAGLRLVEESGAEREGARPV